MTRCIVVVVGGVVRWWWRCAVVVRVPACVRWWVEVAVGGAGRGAVVAGGWAREKEARAGARTPS